MEISDIIRTDQDRLFVVDPECYIIFTGTSIEDNKPFIRIGNWLDMPVELIPLIENIIITDTMIGNPSGEQFNIDIRYLQSNRYIGGNDTVRRFLDFQRIFGLDLTNASVVDVEKDIPELSKERSLSEKSQFIGVFYKDGNFKTVHNASVIVDLKEMSGRFMNYSDLHDRVSRQCAGVKRFGGSGFIIAGHTPIFFSKGTFTSYLFPARYLESFSRLGIDPARIKEIIHPSMTLLNTLRFLKWKSGVKGPITIASDHSALFQNVKKLIPGLSMRRTPFNGLLLQNENGRLIKGYQGTYNIRITYIKTEPEGADTAIAFIKAPGGIKKILSDDLKGILVTYSVFEEAAMLFRTSRIPYAVIDDGHRNISKIADSDTIILSAGTHYEIRSASEAASIAADLGIPPEMSLPADGLKEWAEFLRGRITSADGTLASAVMLSRITVMAALALHSTKDRNEVSIFREIKTAAAKKIDRETVRGASESLVHRIYFFRETIVIGIVELSFGAVEPVFDEVLEHTHDRFAGTFLEQYIRRITVDRERLRQLLTLYTDSEMFKSEYSDSVRILGKDIGKRKAISVSDAIVNVDDYKKVMFGGRDSSVLDDTANDQEAQGAKRKSPFTSIPKRIKIAAAAFLIVLIFTAAAVLFFLPHDAARNGGGEKLSKKLNEVDRVFYEKKYNITIKNSDIFNYANRVARMNGYNSIPYQTIKTGRNPDWIYPKNEFKLTDGEVVVVKEGDTLWDLSRDKLIRLTVQFEEIMKKSTALSGEEKRKTLLKARESAFTDSQIKAVDDLLAFPEK